MAKLTKEQIEAAERAYCEAWALGALADARVNGLRAAAPYLQMPWEPPTDIEIGQIQRYLLDLVGIARSMHYREILYEFVARRNAALSGKEKL